MKAEGIIELIFEIHVIHSNFPEISNRGILLPTQSLSTSTALE